MVFYGKYYNRAYCELRILLRGPQHKIFRGLSQATDNLSTEQKAAELTKAIVPKWKYYTAAASPAIAVLVWTVVILNNQYMKEMTEKYFPGYVSYVREYYGFVYEDYNDEVRKKNTRLAQDNNNYVLTITCQERSSKHVVSGTAKSSDISTIVKNILSVYHVKDVDRAGYTIDLSQIQDVNKYEDITIKPSYEDRSNIVLSSMTSSYWSPNIRKNYTLQDIESYLLTEISNAGIPTPFYRKSFLVERIASNFFYHFMSGFNLFSMRSVLHHDYVSKKNIQQSVPVDSVKKNQYIQEIIRSLEQQLVNMETERRTGVKSFDEVEREITSIKREILQLKREHLNYFYYF